MTHAQTLDPGTELKAHPAADLFPMLGGDELDALAADIKSHGMRLPIVVTDGLILDGRNRAEACRRAGVTPRTLEWDRSGSPWEYVASVNLQRRNLDPSERACIGALLKERLQEETLANRTGRPKKGEEKVPANWQELSEDGEWTERAARIVGVSARSVARAAAVRAAAPEVFEAVQTRRIAVSEAEKISRLPSEARDKVVAERMAGGKQDARGRKQSRVNRASKPRQVLTSVTCPSCGEPFTVAQ